MRFIGNKEKLLDKIYQEITKVGSGSMSFCDFFSGTSNVGRYFKEKGYEIVSSDILYFSYCLQRAYIENNGEPSFNKLIKHLKVNQSQIVPSPFEMVRQYLNSLKGKKGFIYKNYTEEGTFDESFKRKFFSAENGMLIDAVRIKINEWYTEKLINDDEYYVLLAALIESVPFYANISGVYAAFLKQYDPRSLKRFQIKPMRFYDSRQKHEVYNKNSMELIDGLNVDILYLDPPYNERQYAPNYHLLETIALYDNPKIKGITGMRDYSEKKSEFCNAISALNALERVASQAKYKHLILSYNSEGIMSQDDILKTLKKYGTVKLENIDYPRFKSNSNGEAKHKKIIQEQLYILTR